MDETSISSAAETILRDAASALTTPQTGECLVCFVSRMVDDFGCNGTHRFTLRFRDLTAPAATALLERLARKGACCCDCEVIANAYVLVHEQFAGYDWGQDDPDDQQAADVAVCEPLPPCRTVRRGSTQPCANWLPSSRGSVGAAWRR